MGLAHLIARGYLPGRTGKRQEGGFMSISLVIGNISTE
jgi:hypothetical protein